MTTVHIYIYKCILYQKGLVKRIIVYTYISIIHLGNATTTTMKRANKDPLITKSRVKQCN